MAKKRQDVSTLSVALGIPQQNYHGRQIVHGVISYARRHPGWDIAVRGGVPCVSSSEIHTWPGDGRIVSVYEPSEAKALRRSASPVVNVSSMAFEPPLPTVCFDNQRIGEVAADHLLGLGLTRFAFFGPAGVAHGAARLAGFEGRLSQQGARCVDCRPDMASEAARERPDIHSFLNQCPALQFLETPVGVFAANDQIGYGVLKACGELGLAVPDDVALVACDNDETLCMLTPATMSSINPHAWDLGYRAAELLDRLMRGESAPESPIVIEPGRVAVRNSSDIIQTEDPYVADALRYIRNHANEFFDVTDVVRVIPVSRRSLERRFSECVGHGIYQEIQRVHIERAKQLLEDADLPILEVAFRSGYHTLSRFDFNFNKIVGVTASVYQQRHQK